MSTREARIPLTRLFSRKPDGNILAMRVVEEVNRRLPNVHLVMSGTSLVWQELRDAAVDDCKRPQNSDVPAERILRGIQQGERRTEDDTASRVATTCRLSKVAQISLKEFDSRESFKPAMHALGRMCRDRFGQSGAVGNASPIATPTPPAEISTPIGGETRSADRHQGRRRLTAPRRGDTR